MSEKVYFSAFPNWLRLTVLPWYIWAAVILTAIWATNAASAEVFRVPGPDGKDAMVVRLHETSCADKDVLKYLHENILDDRRFKKADLEWEGQPFGACWIELNGRVHPIGSDKKPIQPPIPRIMFREEGV